MNNSQNQKINKMKNLINIILALGILFFSSCKKDNDDEVTPEVSTSNVKMMFQHTFDGTDFELNTKYITDNGDTVNITKIAYFISNIKLTGDNGESYVEKDSYHLVQKTDGELMDIFTLPNVPVGTYTKLEFSIGVDAVTNSSLTNYNGDLDPSKNPNMAWVWKTGFKFFSLEATSISKNNATGALAYHIGNDVNYKTKTISLLPTLNVSKSTSNELMFMSDVSQVFKSPTTIDIENYQTVMGGDAAKPKAIADNYNKMFMLHHVK
jgi:hypothetical protein